MIKILKASQSDIPIIKNICDDARRFQLSLGFNQWKEGYPSVEIISADIASCRGHLILLDDTIVGYCVVDPDGDSEYDLTPELWRWHGSYAAVHRLALSSVVRGKKLGKEVIKLIEETVISQDISYIRIDTGLGNVPMQKLMNSAGYLRGRQHEFSWGKRIVYEKSLAN